LTFEIGKAERPYTFLWGWLNNRFW